MESLVMLIYCQSSRRCVNPLPPSNIRLNRESQIYGLIENSYRPFGIGRRDVSSSLQGPTNSEGQLALTGVDGFRLRGPLCEHPPAYRTNTDQPFEVCNVVRRQVGELPFLFVTRCGGSKQFF